MARPTQGQIVWQDRSGVSWELVEGAWATNGYVKNLPADGSDICTGVQRIVLFNPGGPVEIGIANERPSIAFRQRQWNETASEKANVEAALTTAEDIIANGINPAETVDRNGRAVVVAGNGIIEFESGAEALAFHAQMVDQPARLQDSLDRTQETIDAMVAENLDMRPIAEVNAAVERRRT